MHLPFLPLFPLVEEGKTRLQALLWPKTLLQALRVTEYKFSFKQLPLLLHIEVSHEAGSGLALGPAAAAQPSRSSVVYFE